MQLNKSRALDESWVLASVLANRIQMCTKENSSENSSSLLLFLFFYSPFDLGRERKIAFLSSHNFSYILFYSFSILSTFIIFFSLLFITDAWHCVGAFVRSILSQFLFLSFLLFPSFHSMREPFLYPRLEAALPIYIACGVWLILPEPFRLGKKQRYWKFSIGWRLFLFPLRRFLSLSIEFRLFHFWTSHLAFDFYR